MGGASACVRWRSAVKVGAICVHDSSLAARKAQQLLWHLPKKRIQNHVENRTRRWRICSDMLPLHTALSSATWWARPRGQQCIKQSLLSPSLHWIMPSSNACRSTHEQLRSSSSLGWSSATRAAFRAASQRAQMQSRLVDPRGELSLHQQKAAFCMWLLLCALVGNHRDEDELQQAAPAKQAASRCSASEGATQSGLQSKP